MQEPYITDRQAREMNALLAKFYADPANAAEFEQWEKRRKSETQQAARERRTA